MTHRGALCKSSYALFIFLVIAILDIQFRDARQSSRQLYVLSFPPLCARLHTSMRDTEIALVSVIDTLRSSSAAADAKHDTNMYTLAHVYYSSNSSIRNFYNPDFRKKSLVGGRREEEEFKKYNIPQHKGKRKKKKKKKEGKRKEETSS
uniref:Uncharacterized protein n=1 Tax=Trichogramma kaykai TaxID=54128 RepID=A0ABD2XQQ6_9HYME